MRRSTFAAVDLAEATAVLNRIFEEYLLPLEFSQVQMEVHLEANQIDRSLSPIWYADDGTLLAAGTLAVREERGWIGGFGVAPPHRRRGIAGALLESIVQGARLRALRSIALEVLVDNTGAIRTYERGGFSVRRTLESSRLRPTRHSAASGRLISVAPLLERRDPVAPCWQRETVSLRSQPAICGVALAEDAFAIFRHNRNEAQILKIEAQCSDHVAALASSIAEAFELEAVSLFNEPAESAIAGYVRELGWERTFEQYEMAATLVPGTC